MYGKNYYVQKEFNDAKVVQIIPLFCPHESLEPNDWSSRDHSYSKLSRAPHSKGHGFLHALGTHVYTLPSPALGHPTLPQRCFGGLRAVCPGLASSP